MSTGGFRAVKFNFTARPPLKKPPPGHAKSCGLGISEGGLVEIALIRLWRTAALSGVAPGKVKQTGMGRCKKSVPARSEVGDRAGDGFALKRDVLRPWL